MAILEFSKLINNKHLLCFCQFCIAFVLYISCGGGGGSSSQPVPPPKPFSDYKIINTRGAGGGTKLTYQTFGHTLNDQPMLCTFSMLETSNVWINICNQNNWSPTQSIFPSLEATTNPDAAGDINGDIMAVAAIKISGTYGDSIEHVMATHSVNGVWGTPNVIGSTYHYTGAMADGPEATPHIKSFGPGKWIAAWTQYGDQEKTTLYVSLFYDDMWHLATQLDRDRNIALSDPIIACGKDNSISIYWEERNSKDYYISGWETSCVRRMSPDLSWSDPIEVMKGKIYAFNNSDISIIGGKTELGRDIYHQHWNGTNWESPSLLQAIQSFSEPVESLASIASDGTLLVAWAYNEFSVGSWRTHFGAKIRVDTDWSKVFESENAGVSFGFGCSSYSKSRSCIAWNSSSSEQQNLCYYALWDPGNGLWQQGDLGYTRNCPIRYLTNDSNGEFYLFRYLHTDNSVIEYHSVK